MDGSAFSCIHVDVEVLPRRRVVIPASVVKRLGLVLGANLFLQLLDALLVLCRLLLVVGLLARG